MNYLKLHERKMNKWKQLQYWAQRASAASYEYRAEAQKKLDSVRREYNDACAALEEYHKGRVESGC